MSSIAEKLNQLLSDFGPPRKVHHPIEPIKRLPRDELWELTHVPEEFTDDLGSLQLSHLTDNACEAGFPYVIHAALANDRNLLCNCIELVLDNHFPPSLHDSLLRSLGLPLPLQASVSTVSRKAKRDPAFRETILSLYHRSCAICGSVIRLRDSLLDLDAAHIMWHAEGGPDNADNGLCLCSFHHRAFDRGAIGLTKRRDTYSVMVSEDVNGIGPNVNLLQNYEGKEIYTVTDITKRPNPDYVAWHRDQVFR